MILFLDFDGVTHPIQASEAGYFQHAPALENVLRDFPLVQIVISSSWRFFEDFEQLKSHFSPAFRERIIDVTPTLEPNWLHHARFLEISAWIEKNDYWGDWIALDDQYTEFPQVGEGLDVQEHKTIEPKQAWHPNLIWCHRRMGLRQCNLDELRRRLESCSSF